MAKKLSAQDAQRFLSSVDGNHCFWVCNGAQLNNLEQLRDSLKSMDAGSFGHHVNKQRNDFFNWVSAIVQDKELASSIRRVKSKKGIHAKVSKRVAQLKRARKKRK